MTNKILFIIFFIIIIFLHKKINKIQNNINKEKFTLTNDDETRIRSIIKDIYSTDLDAIRSLAAMSKRIQDGGLTINGDLNVTGAFNYLPRGVILSYNSETAPSGWAICDGNNGTPDLRGKFIRMWNDNMTGFDGNGAKLFTTDVKSTYNEAWHGTARGNTNSYILKHKFGSYAGTDLHHQNSLEMATHNHGITDPGHNHYINFSYDRPYGSDVGSVQYNLREYSGASVTYTGYGKTGITINNSGSSGGATNQPPYYVLTWIMKL
jgi:microcystin-dependent protein